MKSNENLTRQRVIIFEMERPRPLVVRLKGLHSSKSFDSAAAAKVNQRRCTSNKRSAAQ